MKIEVLFPEYCNLYGDNGNAEYLKRCFPTADFKETPFTKEPHFVKYAVDMVIISSMTEKAQEKVIEKLMPHKQRLNNLINGGTPFLATGNAAEVFFEQITDAADPDFRLNGLGIFPFAAERDMMNRYGGLVLGKFKAGSREFEVIGWQTQFTRWYAPLYANTSCEPFLEVINGRQTLTENGDFQGFEGIRKNNFIGTSVLGPLLMHNPKLTRYIITLMTGERVSMPFENEINAAYAKMLEKFKNPKADID